MIVIILIFLPNAFGALVDPPRRFSDEHKAWTQAHPTPKSNASPQEKEAFNQEFSRATADWVQRWPDDADAQLWHLRSLSRLESTSDEQLEQVGETVLKVAKRHPFPGIRFVPYETEVVSIWNARNIAPTHCLQLLHEGVRAIEESQSANPSATKQHFAPMVGSGLFQTLSIQVDLARKLKQFAIAASAVDEMKRWLDKNPGDPGALDKIYLLKAGELAETEGHKADALGYYSQLASKSQDGSAKNHAAALWKEMDGTEQGFTLWMSFVNQRSTIVTATQARSSWTTMNKPLTTFKGTDMKGKSWSIDDLKGKTSLVTVWATWCAPCHAELPLVQKLFEQFKGREDVQVVTVSTDKKVTDVALFTARNYYTFPIISMSPATVNQMVGFEGIPRTWIVDSTGSVRLETIGYRPADWPDQVLQLLAAVK